MECLEKYLAKISEIKMLATSSANLLNGRLPEARAQSNATTRSALVLLTGYFEGFLREIITELSESISDAKPPIEKLHPLLLASSLEDELPKLRNKTSSEYLLKILRNEDHLVLNHKKLSKTGGNPTVDNVEALFGCFGISSVLDYLSIKDYGVSSTFTTESQVTAKIHANLRQRIAIFYDGDPDLLANEICEVFETKWQPKMRRRSVGYVGAIEELLKKRNRIAHGENDEPVTPQELSDNALMIEKLITGLDEMANLKLASLINVDV